MPVARMGILLQSPVFYKVTASDILLGCSFFSLIHTAATSPAITVIPFLRPGPFCLPAPVMFCTYPPICTILRCSSAPSVRPPSAAFSRNDALTVSPGQQPESAPGSLHPKLRFEAVVSAPVPCHNAGRALIFLRRSGGLCYILCRTCGKSD